MTPPTAAEAAQHAAFQAQLDAQIADAMHQRDRDHRLAMETEAWEVTHFILKTLATVNGGAIIAILALVGSIIANDAKHVPARLLVEVLAIFGTGLMFVLLAATCGFVRINFYIRASRAREWTFSRPWVEDTEASRASFIKGRIARIFGVAFAVGSLACAVWGAIRFTASAPGLLSG